MVSNYLIAIAMTLMLMFSGCCGSTGKIAETGVQGQASAPSAPAKQVVDSNQAAGNTQKNIENGEVGKTYSVNYLNSNYEVTVKRHHI